MKVTRTLFALPSLLCIGAAAALAQAPALPTSQPALLTIYREAVKIGRAAEHERIEAGWPAAYAKAKFPTYNLAMTSLTGRSEAWFLTPYASNAAVAEDMKRETSDTVLAAELARLSRADAEVLDEWRIIQAMARPDLSHGTFPELTKVRYWEVFTLRVRPGHESEFEAAAKAYGAASDRVAPGRSYRIYQVTAGMLEPTFLVFSSVEAYAQFDEMLATGQKTMQGFTPEEMTTMQKFFTAGVISTETNRFALNPTMSYVAPETRAKQPERSRPKRPQIRSASN
jgi:hypothetical protein